MARNWSYNEGKALITAYVKRKENYSNGRNKPQLWQDILTELKASNVLESRTTAEHVEVKWRSIYRAYRTAKETGTGSARIKILFMDEMEEIFHDNPDESSPQSVSDGMELSSNQMKTKTVKQKGKPKKGQLVKESLLDIKRRYYDSKIKEEEKKIKQAKRSDKKEKEREERRQLIFRLIQEYKI